MTLNPWFQCFYFQKCWESMNMPLCLIYVKCSAQVEILLSYCRREDGKIVRARGSVWPQGNRVLDGEGGKKPHLAKESLVIDSCWEREASFLRGCGLRAGGLCSSERAHTQEFKSSRAIWWVIRKKSRHKSWWIENGGSVYLGGVGVRSKYDQNMLHEILYRLIKGRRKTYPARPCHFILHSFCPENTLPMFFLKGHFLFEGISLGINPTICEHTTSLCNSFLQEWIASKENQLPVVVCGVGPCTASVLGSTLSSGGERQETGLQMPLQGKWVLQEATALWQLPKNIIWSEIQVLDY